MAWLSPAQLAQLRKRLGEPADVEVEEPPAKRTRTTSQKKQTMNPATRMKAAAQASCLSKANTLLDNSDEEHEEDTHPKSLPKPKKQVTGAAALRPDTTFDDSFDEDEHGEIDEEGGDEEDEFEEEGDIDEETISRLPDDQLRELLGLEKARVVNNAADLFQSDENVVPPRLCKPARSQTRTSSDSAANHHARNFEDVELTTKEGENAQDDDKEGEDEIEPEVCPPKHKKTTQKDRAMEEETVHVNAKPANAPSQVHSSQAVTSASKKPWTTLYNEPGKKPSLLVQHSLVQHVGNIAICKVLFTLAIEDAWPEITTKRPAYRRELLLDAAEQVAASDARAKDIINEVRDVSSKFTKFIGNIVLDRLSHERNAIYKAAFDGIAGFQLGVGRDCTLRVKALKFANKYIYPGKWGVDEHGNILWQHDKTKIYQGPELLRTLQQAFFAMNTAFGYKFEEHYKSTHPDCSEAELPMSLIALAATGVSHS
ncbi:hypothetical protein NP233_g12695 [Leucocoprinus birnbaumii]|uniref:DUF6532 domain-containing protein n=1 Tax=Leucocoprinus birnbaumii TaxID=56174 RepID=A0AAD5VI42_9AGAR|nr:hypothetical protein NP233_g12695 [Leucocoprinus birnbaumii]